MNTDPRVDAYIDRLPPWQQEVCRRVRGLIGAADPSTGETIKRTVLPYFVAHGKTVAALQGTKDHVNVFLYDPGLADPKGIITDGHGGSTGRQIKLYEGDELDADAFTDLIRQLADRNRRGGWRKL